VKKKKNNNNCFFSHYMGEPMEDFVGTRFTGHIQREKICLHCFDTVGWAAGRPSSLQKTEWWDAGVVSCLGQGADLHKAQLMPLPVTISCSSKSRLVLPFWYQLTWVVPDTVQGAVKQFSSSSCSS